PRGRALPTGPPARGAPARRGGTGRVSSARIGDQGAVATVGETPPGWYEDQDDPTLARWWDGERWTEHTLVIAEQVPNVQPPPPPGYGRGSGSEAFLEDEDDDWNRLE